MPGNVSDDATLLAAFDYVSFICIFYELTSFSTNRPTTVVKWQSNVRVIVKPKMSPPPSVRPVLKLNSAGSVTSRALTGYLSLTTLFNYLNTKWLTGSKVNVTRFVSLSEDRKERRTCVMNLLVLL
jgi:hypothetical protein